MTNNQKTEIFRASCPDSNDGNVSTGNAQPEETAGYVSPQLTDMDFSMFFAGLLDDIEDIIPGGGSPTVVEPVTPGNPGSGKYE